MKLEESNKLIAVFMGWESEAVLEGNHFYHTNWDHLIPVLKHIREVVNVELTFEEFDNNRGLEQRLNPYEYDIDSIYKGVIEFIKTYNHIKNK